MSLIGLGRTLPMQQDCYDGLPLDLVQRIYTVMRYLKSNINFILHYQSSRFILQGYNDVDFNILSYNFKPLAVIYLAQLEEYFLGNSKNNFFWAQASFEQGMITLDTASENGSWLRCLLAKYPLWKNRRQLCRSNRVVLQHFKENI